MTVAIMQPYCFPYMGYFQLMAAADAFVAYDDAQYIKGGWVNRNRILLAGKPHLFTVPLHRPSIHASIADTVLHPGIDRWQRKWYKTLAQAYAAAPYKQAGMDVVERAMVRAVAGTSVSMLAIDTLSAVCDYIGLECTMYQASDLAYDRSGSATEKVISICHHLGADSYVNASGGRALYEPSDFSAVHIDLQFLAPLQTSYLQINTDAHIPNLSIIDALMHLPPDGILTRIQQYQI